MDALLDHPRTALKTVHPWSELTLLGLPAEEEALSGSVEACGGRRRTVAERPDTSSGVVRSGTRSELSDVSSDSLAEEVALKVSDGLGEESGAEEEEDVGRDDEEDREVDAGRRGVNEV